MTIEESVRGAKQQVCRLGAEFSAKGWLPATAGNLSVRVHGTTDFCVTRSGADKGNLSLEDVLWVDKDGEKREENEHHPSAETIVHQVLYAKVECGCVVHVHTIYNNIAAGLYFDEGFVEFTGHELLKALDHWNPSAVIRVPIVENYADIPTLGQAVRDAVVTGVPAVLVRNHGIYVWGKDAGVAKRYLEALEFLFEYDVRFKSIAGHRFPPSDAIR